MLKNIRNAIFGAFRPPFWHSVFWSDQWSDIKERENNFIGSRKRCFYIFETLTHQTGSVTKLKTSKVYYETTDIDFSPILTVIRTLLKGDCSKL